MHGKHEQMLTLTISAYGWFLVHGFISDWFERMCYAPMPRAWETEKQMTKPLPPNSWKDWIIALTPNHTHRCTHGDATHKGDIRLEGDSECLYIVSLKKIIIIFHVYSSLNQARDILLAVN